MSEPSADTSRISFTVKELLAKMDTKLDAIVARLDEKADAHDLEQLEARVGALERTAATEQELAAYRARHAKDRRTDRRWLIGIGLSTFLTALALTLNALGYA